MHFTLTITFSFIVGPQMDLFFFFPLPSYSQLCVHLIKSICFVNGSNYQVRCFIPPVLPCLFTHWPEVTPLCTAVSHGVALRLFGLSSFFPPQTVIPFCIRHNKVRIKSLSRGKKCVWSCLENETDPPCRITP